MAEPYYNLGNLFHIEGDLKSAVAQTQQSLRLAGENDKLAQKAFYNLGNSYFLAEDWPSAIKAYQEALLLDSNDIDAKHNMELALQNIQRQQQQNGNGPPQQKKDGEGQQPGESDKSQPQDKPGDKKDQSGGGEDKKDEKSDSGKKPDKDKESGDEELTQDEAERLLDGLSQNSQTLQERLNQTFDGKNRRPSPKEDW